MPESSEPKKVLLGRYEVGRLLGCGAFAKVYYARDIHTGQSVALKAIPKRRFSSSSGGRQVLAAGIMREIAIMRRLRHPHILRLLEVLATRTKVYLAVEYLKGGELFSRLAQSGRMPEDVARHYFRQLISAVGHCHARGVSHRDLKPENLLLDDHGNLKVSDFGLGALPESSHADGMLHTLCGTPAYVAPEILAKAGYSGHKVDIWSCGVILFVFAAGYLPFNDVNVMNLYRKIYNGEFRCPKWFSPELKRLISRLLDTNPETRISIDEIVEDQWFRKGFTDSEVAMFKRFHFYEQEEQKKFSEEGRELNAFDIISFSSGADLSGLFGSALKRVRFVLNESVETVLNRVEEIGKEKGSVVRRIERKNSGVLLEGHYGNLVAKVELHRLTAEFVVVEVESSGEGEAEKFSGEFWKEQLGVCPD